MIADHKILILNINRMLNFFYVKNNTSNLLRSNK